ncbi:uncharacterized protein [Drosophila bipectinata]|uniref:uncharacterized protein n=1 Tax=Drosophila bipectinata TaxID=42026 RepID=UPI001C8909BA|nr:uncharacterized protein LOC108133248 [Drosophila bipectinata]
MPSKKKDSVKSAKKGASDGTGEKPNADPAKSGSATSADPLAEKEAKGSKKGKGKKK